jgi:hypothetical protein
VWSKRILTPIGKIVVIKSIVLAKIINLFITLPNPPIETIKALQTLLFRFLCNDKQTILAIS